MKVVLTGGGTGGHFYPLIAVAEEINIIRDNDNLDKIKIYYLSDSPYDLKSLNENGISFRYIAAGKLRLEPSFKNFVDIFKTGFGVVQAIISLFALFPDVVFSKGGYAAFPTVFAAKLLGIPVIIHESDSAPGRVNEWTAKFAKTVAVSYKQNIDYFPPEKVIHTGQPIRIDLQKPTKEGAYEFLGLDRDIPVIWILGGSLGAQIINTAIEESLNELLGKYQIIHQVGEQHVEQMRQLTKVTLADNEFRNRYHQFGKLNILSMKMIAGIADIVISRAGSTLFEIAYWEIPSIIIPIKTSHRNHQIKNAYNYAREGACIVIEENNLSKKLLTFEINRIYDNSEIKEKMVLGARHFAIKNASEKIAKEIIAISLVHEK